MIRSIPISVDEFARRFGQGKRWAAATMRKMRHVEQGRRLWTTEAWLAEWLVAESIPAQNWPPKDAAYDPLEDAVTGRVISLFGELVTNGKIKVVSL